MDQNSENNGGIEFQDTNWQQAMARRQIPKASKMIQWAIKLSGGLIKTEKQANYAWLALIGVIIIVTLYLFGII